MKKNRAAFTATVALAALLPIMTPTSAAAWGPKSLADAVASALEKVLASQTGQVKTNEKLDQLNTEEAERHQTEEGWWQQFIDLKVASDKDALTNDQNMRQLEDERARLREVQRERFEATKQVASTHAGCVIRTRLKKGVVYDRPDLVIGELTAQTLQESAAFNLGEEVGGSGEPVETVSYAHKLELLRDALRSDARDANAMFGTGNFANEQAYSNCSNLAALAVSEVQEDLSDRSAERDPNSGEGQLTLERHNARRTLTEYFLQGACAVRKPITESQDSLVKDIVQTALAMPNGAYSEGELMQGGKAAISVHLAKQVRAQEWKHLVADPNFNNPDGEPRPAYNTHQYVSLMAGNLAFMTEQLNDLATAISDQNTLIAINNSALNDAVMLLHSIDKKTPAQ